MAEALRAKLLLALPRRLGEEAHLLASTHLDEPTRFCHLDISTNRAQLATTSEFLACKEIRVVGQSEIRQERQTGLVHWWARADRSCAIVPRPASESPDDDDMDLCYLQAVTGYRETTSNQRSTSVGRPTCGLEAMLRIGGALVNDRAVNLHVLNAYSYSGSLAIHNPSFAHRIPSQDP